MRSSGLNMQGVTSKSEIAMSIDSLFPEHTHTTQTTNKECVVQVGPSFQRRTGGKEQKKLTRSKKQFPPFWTSVGPLVTPEVSATPTTPARGVVKDREGADLGAGRMD